MTIAAVHLWGRLIGAVSLDENETTASFQYDAEFAQSGIEVAPLKMPLSQSVYRFPDLAPESFHGLPGLLSDSLPDKFGNALINAWLASQGRKPASFNAVERLLYTGTRGMGALEFHPAKHVRFPKSEKIDLGELVALASDVLTHQNSLKASFADDARKDALRDILRVGTSAGGARAKAIIALDPVTQEVRSGQVSAGDGFDYWLLKFDGVAGNSDRDQKALNGFGAVEYAYYLMARAAGIIMAECRLLEDGPRRHFMARRFDRLAGGEKLHMQSLAALMHFYYNSAGAYSYEQAVLAIRALGLPPDAAEEQFRRAVFNIMARNQDDHVKNIAFLMNKKGTWSLSPAFDLTYAYNPQGAWTSRHQMTLNGKRDDFSENDFAAFAATAGLKRGRHKIIIAEVAEAVARWKHFADQAGVAPEFRDAIAGQHRVRIT